MKNKTINLSVWMFFKAVPAALLVVYYGMCAWNGYDPVIRYLHAACLTLAGASGDRFLMQRSTISLMSLRKKI